MYQLEGIDNRTLLWGKKSIDSYIQKLLKGQPGYILGLGIYSGKDRDFIHIELRCNNKFRKEFLYSDQFEEIAIEPFISPNENARFTNTIRHSWCNLVSFEIMRKIENGELKSRYTFLHLPKNMISEEVSKNINEELVKIL